VQIAVVRRMHNAGVLLLASTDSLDTDNVVGFAVARELELLVQAGLTPLEALQSATIRPAEFLERTDVGSVAEGKIADLVVLTADPTTDIGNIRRIKPAFPR
jgi:imidazolonepropionase-like amidohydrolase